MTTNIQELPTMTPSRLVARELRAEMARQGVSGRELARRLGREQSWVSRHVGLNAPTSLTLEDLLEMTEARGVSAERFLLPLLPRLDSNQQPSGYQSSQVRGMAGCPGCGTEGGCTCHLGAAVVDLFTRERVA